ncbi:hypothetical protein DERP_004994 [Dermatophagoides pteronyssinus]|uniref:Uncharacterized protein n=1 Tax=Dermatophagoides pteronyssinus TaxID=6956 RepID=A0ABQ8JT74_DERPT|nr:hypothetical protein DERP_004994 [Dermatophagoides pteronyssinus]
MGSAFKSKLFNDVDVDDDNNNKQATRPTKQKDLALFNIERAIDDKIDELFKSFDPDRRWSMVDGEL